MNDKHGIPGPFTIARVRAMVAALAGICATHLVFAVVCYGSLPDSIPFHFDAAGKPDHYAPLGVGSWFLLWFISAGIGALFGGFSLKIHTMPERYLSLPRKQAFLSLPPEAKARVWAVAAFHLLVFTAISMLIFLILHIFAALVAFEVVDRLPVVWLLAGIGASIAEAMVMTVRLLKVVNAEIDRNARRAR